MATNGGARRGVPDPSSKWTDGRDRREPVVPSRLLDFRFAKCDLEAEAGECNFEAGIQCLKACLQVLQGSFAKGLFPTAFAAVVVANFPFCKEKPDVVF